MLDDERYDFSKDTNIKEKLYKECLKKKAEMDEKKTTRTPVSLADLENRVITKMDKSKGLDKEMRKER